MESMQIKNAATDEISRRLCRTLDGIGYSEEMMKFRRTAQQHIVALQNTMFFAMKVIPVGSAGEGISKYLESDVDMIYVIQDVFTSESSSPLLFPDQATVFRIRKSYPGYCILQLLKKSTVVKDIVMNSLVPYQGEWILSSSVLKDESKVNDPSPSITMSYTGPAQTAVNEIGLIMDNVLSLSFDCRNILHEWFTRPRKQDWPPQHFLQAAHEMKGNLVPTGMNESETKHLEWRFCFNEIELMLVESLNDSQLKLYKMLKMIKSDILKPKGFSVTSYILKNLVFWLAETYPQSRFRPETLLYWIEKSLLMLKRAVRLNYIPYFMLPERNLLKEKIKLAERKPLYDTLAELIRLGPGMVFGCKKIDEARYMTPNELTLLQQNIYDYELAFHFQYTRHHVLKAQGMSLDDIMHDETYRRLEERRLYLARSREWPPHIREKLNKCQDRVDVDRVFLF